MYIQAKDKYEQIKKGFQIIFRNSTSLFQEGEGKDRSVEKKQVKYGKSAQDRGKEKIKDSEK